MNFLSEGMVFTKAKCIDFRLNESYPLLKLVLLPLIVLQLVIGKIFIYRMVQMHLISEETST